MFYLIQKKTTTVEQAVIAYSRTDAYAEFAEKAKGILNASHAGRPCCFIAGYFFHSNEQLPATKSVLTIVDGKMIFNRLKNNDNFD